MSSGVVFVRPFSATDAMSLYAAVQSSIETFSLRLPWAVSGYNQESAENYIAYSMNCWFENSAFPLGIFDAFSGKVIGGAGIHNVNKAYDIGSIGYWVAENYRNKGVAKAAARLSANIGFNDLGLQRLEIVINKNNTLSEKVALSIGAKLEGVARNRLKTNGVQSDALVYSLIPSDLVS